MNKPSVDDALKEGIYGLKEIKPEEKRKFLGTFRERVVIALKIGQVAQQKIYPQIEQTMKEYSAARLLLNGNIAYEQLLKYINLAKKNHIEYKLVTNHDTEIGLVLAMNHAIDKETIYVGSAEPSNVEKKKISFLKKLFRRYKK